MRLMDTLQVTTNIGTAFAVPTYVVFPAGYRLQATTQGPAAPGGIPPGRPRPLMLSCERAGP